MFAAALPSDHALWQGEDLPLSVRVDARLMLHVEAAAGTTRIAERHEAGALRLRFPRAHGAEPEAVIVNVAGGLAGGDRVAIEIAARSGAGLVVSSAAAERIYRSAGRDTTIAARLRVEDGARCLWLPQETILQDGARLVRRFEIDLSANATLVFGEMLYFGRRAAGESITQGALHDIWRLRRAGRLILADQTRLAGDFAADLVRPGALRRHVAIATLLIAGPDAGEHLAAIRAALPEAAGMEAGASDLGGLVLARIASEDAAALRRAFLTLARRASDLTRQIFPRAFTNSAWAQTSNF